ncbi:DUF3168 domain-containing protein [Paralcaligenes ginsengisoli]
MMLPLVFPILNVSAITALIGSSPVRIYRHGTAPQDVAKPYITWFVVADQPYNQLSSSPCGDFDSVQIDAWSESDTEIETLGAAIRMALDAAGLTNHIVIDGRDPDTKLYRISQEADFISNR